MTSQHTQTTNQQEKAPMIKIDSEFQSLIPPLSNEEKQQLEANLIADGCRDPLVVWGETLIDGHNRFEICTRLGLPFKTVSKEFESRDDAIEWVINNQFGRRNLSDYQRGVLALRMKPIIEARALSQQGARHDLSPKSDECLTPIRTDVQVANLANLGKDSIRKIEHIEAEAFPEIKALAAADELSINLASQFTELPQEAQKEAIEAIATSSDSAKEVIRDAVRNHRAIGTGENEWYTPGEYVDLAREVMGVIDLDPASCDEANEVVKAAKYYTKENSGLDEVWSGRVWMNPPYSRDLMPSFIEKIKTSFLDGSVTEAVVLTHNNTDTQWFHSIASISRAMCFNKRRIKFYRGNEDVASPTNGQTFFYLGDNIDKFSEVFGEIGIVVEPV